MAEKITASWFNRIIDAIKRLKNLGFAFSTEGVPNKITINLDGTTGKLYTPSDFGAINAIIQRMSVDEYLQQTNNASYPAQQIYYNTVSVGKRGQRPLLDWKNQLDRTVDSWQYITCYHGAAKTNGVNSVACQHGSNSNGDNTNGYCQRGLTTNGHGTNYVCNTNYSSQGNRGWNHQGTCSNATVKDGKGSNTNGMYSPHGTNSNGTFANTCPHGDCQQGSDINIRYKTTQG